MEKKDIAAARFKDGFCCSQAVFSVFAPQIGLDEITALKVADGFGSGMTMCSICGAVTGGIMTISLYYGRTQPDDEDSKLKNRATIQDFLQRFKEINGDLECKQLLGCDISIPEAKELAEKNGLFDTVCPRLIMSSVETLENILEKN